VTSEAGGPAPTLGRIVHYRSKTGDYDLAAIVTATSSSLSPAGLARSDVSPLSSDTHVHLHVFTPGKARHYQEPNVPFDPTGAPGTWRWPARV
jgi:hypothetical protein